MSASQLPDMKPKPFWERPEGTTGMITAIIAGGAGLWFLWKALPFIITLLQNTIYATVLGVALFAILWVLLDKRFWTLAGYMYKSAMRAITQVFVEIDPIGVLKNYADDMRKNLEKMNQQISNLRGQMSSLRELIEKNAREGENALKLAGRAREANNKSVVTLKARQAGRLKASNVTLQQLYTRMEVLYRVLKKMYETSTVLVEDMDSEIDVKSRERKAILASYSALRAAMKVMHGDADEKALFDQAMEFLNEDYGRKVGEIEHFVDMSRSFIDSVDLQNGVYEEDAMRMLQEWEQKGDSLLLGDTKQQLIARANDPNDVLVFGSTPAKEPAMVLREGVDYNRLLK